MKKICVRQRFINPSIYTVSSLQPVMHDTHSIKERYNEPVKQKFGPKHIAAILLALAITAAIIIFRGQIRGLEHLGYFGVFLAMLLAPTIPYLIN